MSSQHKIPFPECNFPSGGGSREGKAELQELVKVLPPPMANSAHPAFPRTLIHGFLLFDSVLFCPRKRKLKAKTKNCLVSPFPSRLVPPAQVYSRSEKFGLYPKKPVLTEVNLNVGRKKVPFYCLVSSTLIIHQEPYEHTFDTFSLILVLASTLSLCNLSGSTSPSGKVINT